MYGDREIGIFFSCPSDAERELFDDVSTAINELHLLYKKTLGIEIRLNHWRKGIRPGRGKPRVQNNINQQLIRQCNIFLGILWTRFGSPPGTNRQGMQYGSGTEEEFNTAQDLKKEEIWILFCRMPKDPSLINPTQLKKVIKYKQMLEKNKNMKYDEFFNKKELVDSLKSYVSLYIKDKYTILCRKKTKKKKFPRKQEFRKLSRGFDD